MAWTLVALAMAFATGLSIHILLHKREPLAAAIWLIVTWLVPFGGAFLYWAFGVNRVARRARRRAIPDHGRPGSSPPVPPELEPLRRLGDSIAPHALVAGNSVELLVDGDQAYPAMLAAIDGARATLGFCSYIFDDDVVGRRFFDALSRAARRGVAVRLLVDGVGAWGLGPVLRRELAAAGGQVASFWPRGRWMKHPGLNLRNHRKILVADGTVGFTGSINISENHVTAPGQNHPHSRDLHFRVGGPLVGHLADAFSDDWERATGELLDGPAWRPRIEPCGGIVARGTTTGPDQDVEKTYELLLGALRAARESVDLMTPYFIPDRAILELLRTTGRSGVRVRLLLPRHSDHVFMRWAARAHVLDLLARGVEVFEVGERFVHSKLAVVDRRWVLFGSSNLDARSFRLNFEFDVEAYSEELAAEVLAYMETFRATAYPMKRRDLESEPMAARLGYSVVRLFSPFL